MTNHFHSLSDIQAYEVVQTFENGERIADRVVARHEGAASYSAALAMVRALRVTTSNPTWLGSWAVIYPIYTDGCRAQSPF